MKLLVSWMRELSTYVSREFYFVMRDLVEVHGWRQMEPPRLATDPSRVCETLLEQVGEIPEAILFWEAFDLCAVMQPALTELGCKACLFADDLHQLWGGEAMRDLKVRGFLAADTILCPYAYVLEAFYPELSGRTPVWIPHAASPDFAVPWNQEPKAAVLLSGAVGEHYPLRGRMKDLQEEGRFAITLQEHPGYVGAYDYAGDPRVGRAYANTISKYRAAVTDSSVFGYLVAKHFEIPAAGALLLTDEGAIAPLRDLGFERGVHYLTASLETIEQRLRYIFDDANRAEIDEIRKRGRELVMSRHTTAHRAKSIDEVCGRG